MIIKDIFAKAVMSDKGVDLTDSITITWNDGKMAVLSCFYDDTNR